MAVATTTRVAFWLLASKGPKTGEWTWATCPDCGQVLTVDDPPGGGWRVFDGPSCHRGDGSLTDCQNKEKS